MADMTKEQAIEEIKSWTPILLSMGSKCTENTVKAQEMAIQSLEERKQGEWIVKEDNLCNSCTNIGYEFQSGIVRTKCAFYMPLHMEPDNCGNYVVMSSIPKGTTNGDMIKALFPNLEYAIEEELENATMFVFTQSECAFYTSFDLNWWNAPYKRGNENGINLKRNAGSEGQNKSN